MPRFRDRAARAARTTSVLHRAVAVGLAALLATPLPPAQARDFQVGVEGRQLVMELGGHIVTVPGPLWNSGETADVAKSQILYRPAGPGAESVVLLPVGETVVTWTRLMGIVVVERPGYNGAMQVASMVQPLQADCSPDQVAISRIPPPRAGTFQGLLLMCGRYRPTRKGSHNCAGGITVAVVLESGRGAMKAYDEWCTSSFDVRKPESWPVSAQDLQSRATELQSATLFVPAEPKAAAPATTAAPPAVDGGGARP